MVGRYGNFIRERLEPFMLEDDPLHEKRPVGHLAQRSSERSDGSVLDKGGISDNAEYVAIHRSAIADSTVAVETTWHCYFLMPQKTVDACVTPDCLCVGPSRSCTRTFKTSTALARSTTPRSSYPGKTLLCNGLADCSCSRVVASRGRKAEDRDWRY